MNEGVIIMILFFLCCFLAVLILVTRAVFSSRELSQPMDEVNWGEEKNGMD